MTKELGRRAIYLDYLATTPVDERVIAVMLPFLGFSGDFGNSASRTHEYGRVAAQAVEVARVAIAEAVGASPEEIVFTSGATESNNLAIFGAASFYRSQRKQIITMSTEHKSVLDVCQHLEKDGFQVTYLPPKANGLLDLGSLQQALSADTLLVTVMHVNNELGVIQDIEAIGALAHEQGALFHVDAAQSAGKLPIHLQTLPVDLMSFSAHKNYGPKGVGALYVRHKPRVRLVPRVFGGAHEQGLRAGTLPTHQIAGMGAAFALSESLREVEQAKILHLRQILWEGICDLPGVSLNGDESLRIAGALNVTFKGLDADSLMLALSKLALSTTSACASASHQPSYVLQAIGLSKEEAASSLRISLGRFTGQEDVNFAVQLIREQILGLHTKNMGGSS